MAKCHGIRHEMNWRTYIVGLPSTHRSSLSISLLQRSSWDKTSFCYTCEKSDYRLLRSIYDQLKSQTEKSLHYNTHKNSTKYTDSFLFHRNSANCFTAHEQFVCFVSSAMPQWVFFQISCARFHMRNDFAIYHSITFLNEQRTVLGLVMRPGTMKMKLIGPLPEGRGLLLVTSIKFLSQISFLVTNLTNMMNRSKRNLAHISQWLFAVLKQKNVQIKIDSILATMP